MLLATVIFSTNSLQYLGELTDALISIIIIKLIINLIAIFLFVFNLWLYFKTKNLFAL